MINFKNIFFTTILLLLVVNFSAQTTTFKVTNAGLVPSLIQNNATFAQTPIPLTKVQRDFDVTNLTNTIQQIIVRKTEILLNVLTPTDKALASYCFGINCHGAEVFADTVAFLPNQMVPIEIDFIDASYPGHSLIKYSVYNKNLQSDVVNIYMDYAGVVSIIETQIKKGFIKIFPNPSNGFVFIENTSNNDIKNAHVLIKDCLGKVVMEQEINLSQNTMSSLTLNQLQKGVYMIELEDSRNIVHRQLIHLN